MAEVFKCGDIADIINDNNEEEIESQTETKLKVKKKSKLMKKFNQLIEENKNKVIEIQTIDPKNEDNSESDDGSERQDMTKKEIKLIERKHKSNEKNKRTVFVGNLPKNITIRKLKQLFKQFGRIESIRLRGAVPQEEKMTKKVAVITKSLHSLKDNINAYIVFKSSEDIPKAHEMNGYVLDGHHIRVDGAVKDKVRDQSMSVFVGNLPFVIKEDQLFEFFTDCGDIEAVRVVRDSKTGVGKGFGFISFKSKDGVILALEKNDQKLNGRQLRVIRAKTETKRTEFVKQNKIQPKEQKFTKKTKKSDSKPEFEGISAKKLKRKISKKKGINEMKTKQNRKKLSKIFSI